MSKGGWQHKNLDQYGVEYEYLDPIAPKSRVSAISIEGLRYAILKMAVVIKARRGCESVIERFA